MNRFFTTPQAVKFFIACTAMLLLFLAAPAHADCADPPGEEGVIVYNTSYRTMQFCNGTHWVAMAGGISGTTIGGAKEWEEQDLTDTSAFDGACEYRFRAGAVWYYPHTVTADFLLYDISTAAWKFGAIEKASKNQGWYRDDGNASITSGPVYPVDEMQKKCMVDSVPDAFAFTNIVGAAEGEQIPSNIVTITGINMEIPVSVSGDGSPEISIGGGPWTTFGAVANGQTLQLRLISGTGYETTRTAMLNAGSMTVEWSVTTAPDVTAGTMTYSTPGTYTFTVPAYNALTVRVGGAGGGGHANYSGDGNTQSPTNGGDSSFNGVVIGYGGVRGGLNTGATATGGAGGAAGGGDTNIAGSKGGNAKVGGPKGVGGAGGGAGAGKGGDGQSSFPDSGTGAGGGGGGWAEKTYAAGQLAVGSTVQIIVGAGGQEGKTQTGGKGKKGENGSVAITWN